MTGGVLAQLDQIAGAEIPDEIVPSPGATRKAIERGRKLRSITFHLGFKALWWPQRATRKPILAWRRWAGIETR